MKYSIEIGKIVEGALKRDYSKVLNYTKQLIVKLEEDGEQRSANKFNKLLAIHEEQTLTPMGSSKGPSLPVDNESRTTLADIIYPNDNNTDIILSKGNYDKLNSFILGYKKADELDSLGIEVSNTLLLYGPPGCGKTKCAHYIAKELNLPLVVARLDSLISSYLGTTAKNIRNLFEFVQKTPCVLFLDEFDAIAKARDDSNELGELKRVVNSLLQNVDVMSKDSLLLAATNHENLLDSAVWRRFDYKLEMELPDTEALSKLIMLFLKGSLTLSEKELTELAVACKGLSGAEVEEIIKKSIRTAIIYENELSKHSIYNELFILKNIIPSDEENEREKLQRKAQYLRSCNEKVFSYAVIADILKTSKSTVSKLV